MDKIHKKQFLHILFLHHGELNYFTIIQKMVMVIQNNKDCDFQICLGRRKRREGVES